MRRTLNKIKVNYGLRFYLDTCLFLDLTTLKYRYRSMSRLTSFTLFLRFRLGMWGRDNCSFLYVFDLTDFSRRILQQNESYNWSLELPSGFSKDVGRYRKYGVSQKYSLQEISYSFVWSKIFSTSQNYDHCYIRLFFCWLNQILTKSLFQFLWVSLKYIPRSLIEFLLIFTWLILCIL